MTVEGGGGSSTQYPPIDIVVADGVNTTRQRYCAHAEKVWSS